ncbi:hypothetical protein RBU61_16250 [Tissierella sp. MB52-C2]|uniref:hypothetical protein n=1 Tax=Tissierella sp. MB52-C2 TaxID=3070999 RepID=UPI00280A7C28|nr:hypothetical protein [Tissierella sp. MB52-C2]WMM24464.1 hypothetical protein RBU61_16250 [Tissierella sp. MB52-C2]
MNKKFITDQYIGFMDNKRVQNVLKFYQSTVNIQELYNLWYKNKEYIVDKINIKAYDNYFDLPESYMESVSFNRLSIKEKIVMEKMNDFFKNQEFIYILPIFIIDKSNNIPSGIYSVDFKNKVLYKYKEFERQNFGMEVFKESFNICISYFIDLNESVFLDGELGFINGIIQIGRLYENIESVAKEKEFETYSKFVPQQSFTHKLGINCRLQLFIKNQVLRGI